MNLDLVPCYYAMPAYEDRDPDPIESPTQGNPLLNFVVECVGDGLDD